MISTNYGDGEGGLESLPSPLQAGLSTPRALSQMLSCSHSLFARLRKERLGKKSDLLFVILHFDFFGLRKQPVG